VAVLEATLVAHVVRPFSTHRPNEIVAAPKVYGFDTGFVCYHRGWTAPLRQDEEGSLWEHFVLNELQGRLQRRAVHQWRNKHGAEVDFVLPRRGAGPIAIESRWSAGSFEPAGMRAFRRLYPSGESFLVASDITRAYARELAGVRVQFVSLEELIARLSALLHTATR